MQTLSSLSAAPSATADIDSIPPTIVVDNLRVWIDREKGTLRKITVGNSVTLFAASKESSRLFTLHYPLSKQYTALNLTPVDDRVDAVERTADGGVLVKWSKLTYEGNPGVQAGCERRAHAQARSRREVSLSAARSL